MGRNLTMPEYVRAKFIEAFYEQADVNLGPVFIPENEEYHYAQEGWRVVNRFAEAWWCRMSDPLGKVSPDEWSGPFATVTMAMGHIALAYCVDPVTGDPLAITDKDKL